MKAQIGGEYSTTIFRFMWMFSGFDSFDSGRFESKTLASRGQTWFGHRPVNNGESPSRVTLAAEKDTRRTSEYLEGLYRFEQPARCHDKSPESQNPVAHDLRLRMRRWANDAGTYEAVPGLGAL
jgi:hypothetical protein